MSRIVAAVVFFLALLPSALPAQDTLDACGTSAGNHERLRSLDQWVRARERGSLRNTAAPEYRQDGPLYIVSADESMIPFHDPFDLVGSSLVFTPQSDDTMSIERTDLAYDTEIGLMAHRFGTNSPLFSKSLPFDLPFYGQNVRQLQISDTYAIYLAAPPAISGYQYSSIDVLEPARALIAPFLMASVPPGLRAAQRQLFIKEQADAITITWRAQRIPVDPYSEAIDIQVRLEKSGAIVFSYREVTNVSWGSVALTSGRESWRSSRSPIVSATDANGDSDAPVDFKALLDITSLEVTRIAGSELLEFRLKFAAPLTLAAVPRSGGVVSLRLSEGTRRDYFTIWLEKVDPISCVPGLGCAKNSSSVRVDDELVFRVLDRYLTVDPTAVLNIEALTWSAGYFTDRLITNATLGSGEPVEIDISALEAPAETSGPIVDNFTLPVLNTYAVWSKVGAALALDPAEVDGVAIYQSFPTDIVFYAGAYSTVGNASADGVWADRGGYGVGSPKFPALLHMNHLRASTDSVSIRRGYQRLLGHELGHRWLQSIYIMENGQRSKVLNPLTAHPAQYVQTPAAFPVYTSNDYSVMGGSRFADSGGAFTTPFEFAAYGYSWYELYLMGLAAPSEVEPWFYLADSEPVLGLEYNPGVGMRFTARRVNVAIDQVTEAMGARNPTSELSQKHLRTIFILLEKSDMPASAEQIQRLREIADAFPPYFNKATGERATIETSLPISPTAAFDVSMLGIEHAFRDRSTGYPASWSWSFGDGESSTSQHPRHVYAQPGDYEVRLTATNSRGAQSTSQLVRVVGSKRKRSVRR